MIALFDCLPMLLGHEGLQQMLHSRFGGRTVWLHCGAVYVTSTLKHVLALRPILHGRITGATLGCQTGGNTLHPRERYGEGRDRDIMDSRATSC